MLSIGLDVSALDRGFKSHAERGIGRYAAELKKYFEALPKGDLSVGFFDHRMLRSGLLDRLAEISPVGRQTLKQQLLYPLNLRRGAMRKFSALHFPAHMDPPSWGFVPYAVTVLDLIPLVLEELYRAEQPGWRFRFARFLEIKAIKGAKVVLAISENTARDVERILGIPRERIVVTPLGVDEKFFSRPESKPAAVRDRWSIAQDAPVILYVGGIDPRKNVLMMLEVFAEVRRIKIEAGETAPVMIMAGGIQTQKEWPKVRAKTAELGLDRAVVFTGYVPDAELLELYSIASIFFFPSLYEGVGLPPLEALAAGLPVVSSNTSAMPEVLGDAALLVDPRDRESMVHEISSLLSDAPRRERMSQEGPAQARKFSWRSTGDKTLEAYKRLANREI